MPDDCFPTRARGATRAMTMTSAIHSARIIVAARRGVTGGSRRPPARASSWLPSSWRSACNDDGKRRNLIPFAAATAAGASASSSGAHGDPDEVTHACVPPSFHYSFPTLSSAYSGSDTTRINHLVPTHLISSLTACFPFYFFFPTRDSCSALTSLRKES